MAAQSWRANAGSSNCPSVARLRLDAVIDPAQPELDPWGGAYLIECSDDEVTVSSSGPDAIWRTADDIQTP